MRTLWFLLLVISQILWGAFSGRAWSQDVSSIPAPDATVPSPKTPTGGSATGAASSAQTAAPCFDWTDPSGGYTVGVDDVLSIDVLKPEAISNVVTVTPDGTISFPYIGNVKVMGRSITQVQDEIQARLANGYMKYPVVSVSLKESRSRKFFVYGEVLKPGSYPIEGSSTVLRAISMAGGFTRFGSSSRVKVLRPRPSGAGYKTIRVNINAVMDGNPSEDIVLHAGDIVVVSEGVF